MIDNDFVYEPSIVLDMDYLKTMVAEQQYAIKQGLATHQRYVNEIPYLNSIREKLPFLSAVFNIYTTRPNAGIVMHTDAKRSCAFNIPIANTENSTTAFYEFAEEPKLIYNERFVFNEVRSRVNEMFKFTLTVPTLINNSGPHEVKNLGNKNRVIISWSVEEGILFDEAKELFKKAGY